MENLTTLFKILSDQTRLRIILLLSQKEFCVCQLCDILEQDQPKISKNLSKLRDLDLVTTERREKFIFYRLEVIMKSYFTCYCLYKKVSQ